MSKHHPFLNPLLSTSTLDGFGIRRAILSALKDHVGTLHGTVLDIGSGHMPYKSLVMAKPSAAKRYIGLDLYENGYQKPDLEWDGRTMPLEAGSVDCALATEVFEHCAEPELVMREAWRVLKPGGFLFFTVPFLWPLHDVPHDQYRYTPFALERHLVNSGFEQIDLNPLGGWDASLDQMLGLWVRRRPMSSIKRAILSRLALPVVRYIFKHDTLPSKYRESTMVTGISGTAIKPAIS